MPAQAGYGMDEGSPEGRAAALLLRNLDENRRRLKGIESIERRADLKREMLPAYADHIAGVLAADAGGADPIVGYVLAWRIDTGDYHGAIELARYVIKHGLSMPDGWSRSPAAYLAEQIAEQAFRAQQGDEAFDVDLLRTVVALTDPCDMHDQVRAKLLLALGRQLRDDDLPAEALPILQRAVQLHPGVGAKKDIERLQTYLRRNPALSASAGS